MASSVYSSTPETTNANRACRAVLGPCTDGLRDALRHYVPPPTFPRVIKQKEPNLPRLTADQRDLILPKRGNYTGNYSDMDISLLYILLRNISNMSPHSKGWGNDPDHHDSSLSANIERIRQVRNRCVHSCDPFMSKSDFNSIWSTIRSAMVDLDVFLGNGNQYEREVDFLRHESMDPERDSQYEEELRKQVEEDTKTREMVATLENKMEKLTESVIPPNVREQYDIDIQKWREENKLYYETHSFPSVMEKVRNQPCVTFVGVPGSGKSAMAHHIALKLQEEGYEVVPIKDIRKMEDYGDPRNPQVFVIDDMMGVFGLQEIKLGVMTEYEQKIMQPCMAKSRTLMTCREAVFNETIPYKPFLTKEENVIRLHSSDHALDDKDKKQILKKYGLNEDLVSPALLTSTSHMFPLLCKLFSKETKFQVLGSKFFLNPVQCIIDEFDDMQRHNKLNYTTLVLCMLNENSISKDILKDRKNEYFMNMKIDSLENCELESQTDAFKFVKALSAMEGTYTKQSGAQYAFIHDSMFEICAYHYGKQFPDQVLLYMSSSYIANSVKLQTNESGIAHKVKKKQCDSQSNEGDKSSKDSDGKKESEYKNNEREKSFDLCIRLREDQYPLLAERLYRDIQNMELYDVFRNPVLKHPKVCQAFIGVLETKSYTELKSLFLSSHGEVDKIVSKRECVVKESRERMEWGEYGRQMVLVGQRKKRNDKREILQDENTYNVRVIGWVVYYGHYQIIEYIIQQTAHHSEACELLEKTGNSPHQSKSGIFTCNRQGSENNRLVEQYRLLLLSCYSGDVQTVRILLPVCKKAINGIGQISIGTDWYYHTPLTAACEGGHVSVVEELVKVGADVNLQDIWWNTPLITACKEGHVSVMKELVKAGADINIQDRLEITPLIAACWGGHVSVVEELVKVGADVNLEHRLWITPLTAACKGGHVRVVEELVKAGADINIQGRLGNTPLTAACKGGHVRVVEELVKAQADVDLQNDDGDTPLIAACKEGHVRVMEELVKAGANVNLKVKWKTPLIAACEREQWSMVEELVKAGATDANLQYYRPLIDACYEGHVNVVRELMKVGADANLQDEYGKTPLIVVCKEGHVSVVKELVKAGADANLKDEYGNTPLIAACRGGHVSVVKAGADVNLQSNNGNTPLIAACEGGHMSVVKELVKAGCDVNLQDDDGNTPLIAACEGGHVSVIDELVKVGADVNLQSKYNTPLIAACEGGHVSLVEELVKAGADVNLQSKYNTPLIAACVRGHVSLVEELVKAGADVNLQSKYITPLIAACEEGHVSVIDELVKVGADVNLQSKYNTPLIAACEGGHVSMVEELVKAGADVNLQSKYNTPLIAACEGGHVSLVEELVKAGADVILQGDEGNTPLIAAAKKGSLSTVKYLVEHGADSVTQVVDFNVSAVYAALILNKPDIVKYLIQEQNKIISGKFTGNVHLFNCLVDIRHAGVKTDSRDDVLVTDRSVWCMDRFGDLWMTISGGDCDVLRHLLYVGLNVNQSIQLYAVHTGKSVVGPLLYTLTDDERWFTESVGIQSHRDTTDKVSILLGAGVDVNVRVGYRENVLDREGVSVLERTRRRVWECSESKDLIDRKYRVPEYKKVMCEIKKHVRRHSV